MHFFPMLVFKMLDGPRTYWQITVSIDQRFLNFYHVYTTGYTGVDITQILRISSSFQPILWSISHKYQLKLYTPKIQQKKKQYFSDFPALDNLDEKCRGWSIGQEEKYNKSDYLFVSLFICILLYFSILEFPKNKFSYIKRC